MFSANSILGSRFQILTAGLDGLAMRQQVRTENLANVDTAGYQAKTVDFESVLSAAATSSSNAGSPMDANGAHMPNSVSDAMTAGKLTSQFAVEQTGSRVNRGHEVQQMMLDNIRFRVLSQQVTNRISELRNVISEMGRG
jgi:flagellar basal-body rod protein FlgB